MLKSARQVGSNRHIQSGGGRPRGGGGSGRLGSVHWAHALAAASILVLITLSIRNSAIGIGGSGSSGALLLCHYAGRCGLVQTSAPPSVVVDGSASSSSTSSSSAVRTRRVVALCACLDPDNPKRWDPMDVALSRLSSIVPDISYAGMHRIVAARGDRKEWIPPPRNASTTSCDDLVERHLTALSSPSPNSAALPPSPNSAALPPQPLPPPPQPLPLPLSWRGYTPPNTTKCAGDTLLGPWTRTWPACHSSPRPRTGTACTPPPARCTRAAN